MKAKCFLFYLPSNHKLLPRGICFTASCQRKSVQVLDKCCSSNCMFPYSCTFCVENRNKTTANMQGNTWTKWPLVAALVTKSTNIDSKISKTNKAGETARLKMFPEKIDTKLLNKKPCNRQVARGWQRNVLDKCATSQYGKLTSPNKQADSWQIQIWNLVLWNMWIYLCWNRTADLASCQSIW